MALSTDDYDPAVTVLCERALVTIPGNAARRDSRAAPEGLEGGDGEPLVV